MGTVPLADVRQAGAGGPLMFFQLYVFKDRGFVKRLVQRELLPLFYLLISIYIIIVISYI